MGEKLDLIQQIFEELQKQNVIETQDEILSLGRTSIKAHPNASGVRKISGEQSIGH